MAAGSDGQQVALNVRPVDFGGRLLGGRFEADRADVVMVSSSGPYGRF